MYFTHSNFKLKSNENTHWLALWINWRVLKFNTLAFYLSLSLLNSFLLNPVYCVYNFVRKYIKALCVEVRIELMDTHYFWKNEKLDRVFTSKNKNILILFDVSHVISWSSREKTYVRPESIPCQLKFYLLNTFHRHLPLFYK